MKLENTINVIDLFAGPGGLGEGFFSYADNKGAFPFEGLISVEKDPHAHATLTLRAFYRLLKKSNTPIPSEYYEYARGKAKSPSSNQTIGLWEQAKSETLLLELGKDPKFDKKLFQQVKKSLGAKKNIPTILIGGPPCQAYSLVGRARNKGNKNYIPEKDHRQYLYKEYLSTLQLFSPDIFIMENVKGLLSSQVNGGPVFQQIIRDLENCSKGYTLYSLKTGKMFVNGSSSPKDFILYSEDYGVPQNRHRVIIFGIKKNRNNPEEIPHLQKSHPVSIERAIKDLPQLRSTLSSRGKLFNKDSVDLWIENLQSGVRKLIKSTDLDKKLLLKLKENLSQLAPMSSALDSSYKYKNDRSKSEFSKFVKDSYNKEITLHTPRPHMDMDLLRYFFCSTFREVYKRNARASDFPEFLAPDHKSWNSGKFVDRFKVQSYSSQSSTITSHISKDGHYFIHGDPLQCRSLTVREAARIQSFPDSYHFMGYRTNQFHQVGNAVPPLLARQIASIVNELLFTSS